MLLRPPSLLQKSKCFSPPPPPLLLPPSPLCSQKRDRFLSLHRLPASAPAPQLSRGSLSLFFSLRSLSPPVAMYSIASGAGSSFRWCFKPHILLSSLSIAKHISATEEEGRGERVPKPRTNGQRTDGRRFRGAPPPPPPVPIPTSYSVSVYASLCMQLLQTQV